jgi:hypothetical protein
MFWSIYISIAFAALRVQDINGNDDVASFPRRLRATNSAQSTLKDMVSVNDIMIRAKFEGPDRLRLALEALEASVIDTAMSFIPSQNPTKEPTCDHSAPPSDSPSDTPSDLPSDLPSTKPSGTPNNVPSGSPSATPNVFPTTVAPTILPTVTVSNEPSVGPSATPVAVAPVATPVTVAPVVTSVAPVVAPVTVAPVVPPVFPPVMFPTSPTTLCPNITDEERVQQILAILDAVANPDDIRNNETPQGLATTWIIAEDEFQACPDYPKLVQRWTLAVMYYSTGGEKWFQCSANPAATDLCGIQSPFEDEARFLSKGSECDWAGITCIDTCVTEVEFGT